MSNSGGTKINIHQQISAVDREIQMRLNTYRRLVAQGKLKQSAADYELACMEAVRATLVYMRDHREVIVNAVQTQVTINVSGHPGERA